MDSKPKTPSAEEAEGTAIPQLTERIIGAAIMDLVFEDTVVLELKTVDQVLPIHTMQR